MDIPGIEQVRHVVDTVLWPLAEKVTLRVPAFDAVMEEQAAALGMHDSILRYVFGLYIVYVLMIPYKMLPAGTMRHLYNLVVGVILTHLVLGPDWVHGFISSLGTYLIIAAAPKLRAQHHIAFAWVIVYMSVCHLYMMYVNYLFGRLDFSGTQMVLTIKLTSLAYNVYDGSIGREKLEGIISKETNDRRKAPWLRSQRWSISCLPNLLEYFAYVFNFSTVLAGPAFEFRHYKETVDNTEKHPSPFVPCLTKFSIGLVSMLLFLVCGAYFPISHWNTEEFFAQPLWYRMGYAWVCLFFVRCKFYYAWKITEGAANLAGYGFEGYDDDGNAKGWNGVATMDILQFELPQNIQFAVRAWNKRTQDWLERYVYLRSNKSMLITFMYSAIWHGFYPGYYLFFLTYPLVLEVERGLSRKIHARFYSDKLPAPVRMLYTAVCVIFTIALLQYCAIAFQTYTMSGSIEVWWRGYYCAPHMILLVMYVVLMAVPSVKRKKH